MMTSLLLKRDEDQDLALLATGQPLHGLAEDGALSTSVVLDLHRLTRRWRGGQQVSRLDSTTDRFDIAVDPAG